MDGFYSPSMKEKMLAHEARKVELTQILETAEEPPVLLHPNTALEYRKQIVGFSPRCKTRKREWKRPAIFVHLLARSS